MDYHFDGGGAQVRRGGGGAGQEGEEGGGGGAQVRRGGAGQEGEEGGGGGAHVRRGVRGRESFPLKPSNSFVQYVDTGSKSGKPTRISTKLQGAIDFLNSCYLHKIHGVP